MKCFAFYVVSIVSCVFSQIVCTQSLCDSSGFGFDPRFVMCCNRVEETKTLSRTVSATMIPLALGLPAGFYAYGTLAADREAAITGITMACADVGALALTFAVKNIVRRERPYTSYPRCVSAEPEIDRFSFPSGHACGAAVMATYLGLRYPKWFVIAPASGYALYTFYARMNLGVHYPSDILVGALVGSVVGILAYEVQDAIASRSAKILPKEGIIAPGPRGPLFSIQVPL